VHDYGDICQAITEMAVELNAPVSTEDFRMLNRCLDEAIAGAVTQFMRERHQSEMDEESARGGERLGFFTHELRNLTNTAIVAFEVLKTGNVGVAGSTGAVLHRSLMGLRTLIGRSLAEVRLTHAIQNRERLLVSAFVDEVASAATVNATARGITLSVLPVEAGVTIEADRQVLAAVLGNLLQKRVQVHSAAFDRHATRRFERRSRADRGRGRMRRAAWRKRSGIVPTVRAAQRGSNRRGSWACLQPMGR
jgi:hypothetical protein